MIAFEERARAAMLGLALGDAYGRPLEFRQGDSVRQRPAGPGHSFMWTDDTHMALYLCEALRQHGPAPLDADVLGRLIGEQFCLWLDDPLTPSTAPGNTCMAGARAWRKGRDWRTSGVASSDGCGAVMRVCPVPMLFSGAELLQAAHIQAVLTHAHPNASEASIAACWLLRQVLDGRSLGEALILEAAEHFTSGAWSSQGGTTEAALRAAVSVARTDSGAWLDEAAIPGGDGGWKAPSALGLALTAVLRWGQEPGGAISLDSFRQTIDRAARIDGDSDSVACLAGMFLGAARGMEALPQDWLAELPQRERISAAVDGLLATQQVTSVHAPLHTTKQQDGEIWLAVADLHGHPAHLRALVEHMDAKHGDAWNLVTLGDYVDNGPDTPGLLDELIRLRAERPDRFVPILGNHDLACLRALGWPGNSPDPVWYQRWAHRYWDPNGSTPAAYGAHSGASLAEKMPEAHQAFLRSLPWFYDTGRYLFVHAGMEEGPLAPQRRRLAHKLLPKVHTWLPRQIREKDLAGVSDPGWDRVVVSGHTKNPAERAGIMDNAPHILTDTRICLSGEVDRSGNLYAVKLPSRKILRVHPDGSLADPA